MAEFRVFSGHEQPFLLHPTSQVPPYPEDPFGMKRMKYIVQIYEGEINGHGEREGLPSEYQYEFEQEMLKHIHKLKQELSEKGWSQKESPEVFQTSFLRSEESDAQLGFQFE